MNTTFSFIRVIREVHEEVGASDSSSDSDDEWSIRKSQKPIFKPDSPEEKNIQPTFGPKQHSVRGSKDTPADQRRVSGKIVRNCVLHGAIAAKVHT